MSAGLLTLRIDQGADFKRTLRITDENASPVNITGWVFSGKMRRNFNATTSSSFSFNVLDQITNTGEVEWTMSASLTTSLVVNTNVTNYAARYTEYVYDVEAVLPSTEIFRVVEGQIFVYPEVTHA